MIYTLTFNPSIDYEMNIPHFSLSHTNRSIHEEYRVGGKGINVSTVLKELGFESIVLGFYGGFVGNEIIKQLNSLKIQEQLIELEEGISRINVKMVGNRETEINGEGPFISSVDLQKLFSKLQHLNQDDVLILSGSIPKCINENIYELILNVQTKKGVTCIVDATKNLLTNTLKYRPFLIKPNVKECEDILNCKLITTNDVIEAAKYFQSLGAQNVLISRGEDGAVLIDEYGNIHEHKGLKGNVVSTVGCGDSMVAGFIAAYIKCKNYEESFKMAMSCGYASAFSQGLAKLDKIKECYEKL